MAHEQRINSIDEKYVNLGKLGYTIGSTVETCKKAFCWATIRFDLRLVTASRQTVPGIVATTSGHLKSVNSQWIGLDRSFKDPFDRRFFYLLVFVFVFLSPSSNADMFSSCWCGLLSFNGFCKSVSSHFRLLRIGWQLTFSFRFLSSTILLVEICLIGKTNYDFFPCCFFLFFIFDKPFDVALRTFFDDSSMLFSLAVQTARSNEKLHQLFEVSSNIRMKAF